MKILKETDSLPQGTTAAAVGMFDGVHLGHATLVNYLRLQAAERGLQAMAVTFSRHPQTVLFPERDFRMISTTRHRLDCLAGLGLDLTLMLDFSPQLAQLDSSRFIRLLRDRYGVRLLVVGYNHRFGHNREEKFDDYVRNGDRLGVQVLKAPEYLGEYAPVSSTIIRRLIAAGKVDDACHCMGRPYTLGGKVVHGFRNGSTLGFPTANVGHTDPAVILPHNGAYAVRVRLQDHPQWFDGMLNIGSRPTLDNGNQLSIEVNIFDFEGDIYRHSIELEFIKFLRLEFKMCGLDELRKQLGRDRQRALQALERYRRETEINKTE